MWSTYPTRLQGSWTFPTYYLPRWFGANGYPTLFDSYTLPDTTPGTGTVSLDTPASGMLPTSWVLSESTATTGAVIVERFWESFANERQYMVPLLASTKASLSLFFDEAEPEYAWYADWAHDELIDTVEVQLSGGAWQEVQNAPDDLDLFYSAKWKWRQQGDCLLIYGLDLIEQTTSGDANDWHFLPYPETWDYTGTTYVEHPETKNWIPLHATGIRSDGLIAYIYDGNLRVRNNYKPQGVLIDEVNIRINGTVIDSAKRVQVYNTVDDRGQWFNIDRRHLESNSVLASAILAASWFGGQNEEGFRNYISSSLRTGIIGTVAEGVSSFTLPTSGSDFSLRNIRQDAYVIETLTTDSSGTAYVSRYESPEYGQAFLRQQPIGFTNNSGVISFPADYDTSIDRPNIAWKLSYWTVSGSTVTFTDNFPKNSSDLVTFTPEGVQLPVVSQRTKIKSFNRTSPIFKWRGVLNRTEITVDGLAEFDI